jgi:predicted neuraminidase
VLANSDWLLPMVHSVRDHTHHGADHMVMQITCDEGRTWEECPVPDSRGRVQVSVIELAPAQLIASFRSRAAERIYVSRPADAGRTWTVPERTALPSNNASIQAPRLASGAIALASSAYSAGNDPDATLGPRRGLSRPRR